MDIHSYVHRYAYVCNYRAALCDIIYTYRHFFLQMVRLQSVCVTLGEYSSHKPIAIVLNFYLTNYLLLNVTSSYGSTSWLLFLYFYISIEHAITCYGNYMFYIEHVENYKNFCLS